jgi:hypothetical protein
MQEQGSDASICPSALLMDAAIGTPKSPGCHTTVGNEPASHRAVIRRDSQAPADVGPVPLLTNPRSSPRHPESWSGRRDSNPRHSAWKADAPPTELLPLEMRSCADETSALGGSSHTRYRTWRLRQDGLEPGTANHSSDGDPCPILEQMFRWVQYFARKATPPARAGGVGLFENDYLRTTKTSRSSAGPPGR